MENVRMQLSVLQLAIAVSHISSNPRFKFYGEYKLYLSQKTCLLNNCKSVTALCNQW